MQQSPHGVVQRQPVRTVGPPRQRAGVQKKIDQLQVAVGVSGGRGRGAQGVFKPLGKQGFKLRHAGPVQQRRARQAAQVDLQPVDALHPAGLAQRVA